jgi:hypothetical protein
MKKDMIEQQRGLQQHLLCDDPATCDGVKFWLERVLAAYGAEPCVDIQVIAGQLILNRKTADYLYTRFTPLKLRYKPGSRPFLEKVLTAVVRPSMSGKEKFLAILRRCRDNRDAASPKIQFFGGTEEELVKRGAIMCNEISRVFVVLCQIAGLPARLVASHITGHMMAEVFVDGCWAWCDPMKGLYMLRDDGGFASMWDLVQDPGIVDRQTAAVWNDCRPVGSREDPAFARLRKAQAQAYLRDCCLHPREAFAIGNYFAWDHAKYDYPWHTAAADPKRLDAARIAETTLRMKLGFPAHYFAGEAGMLAEMPLRMKRSGGICVQKGIWVAMESAPESRLLFYRRKGKC